MNFHNRRHVIAAFAAFALGLSAVGALAQAPSADKPERVVLPLSAGSTADAVARAMSTPLSKALGRPLFIENIPGAGGVPGTQQIVNAPKDGTTIGIVTNNFAVAPSIYKKMPFDSVKDITPITVIGTSPFVLVVNKQVPASNVKELVALAKSKPGILNYGSSGNGTVLHLAAELFASEAGVDIKHVPYKGNGPLVNDVLGGQIEMAFLGTTVAEPHIRSGALKAIGISTKTRSQLLPNVPTLAEQGLANYDFGGWIAVIAPAGLPAPVIARLNADVNAAIASPEVSKWLAAQDFRAVGGSQDVTARFFKTEIEKHARLVKQSGATLD